MATQAAIYVRVSTTRQAERDLSLPDQIAQCQAWCEAKGWEVAKVFSEPGASALDDDRPAFQELIYKATRPERPFDYVVVHSLSRFSRDTLHFEIYSRRLHKAGVRLVSITQNIGEDGTGDVVRKILNVFDEHQSRENAKHVHRAMLENARQGYWNGARPPFGYALEVRERRGNRDKKVLVIDEAEARVVRTIFSLAAGAEGRPMGVKAIATHLNERGHTRRGRRFTTGNVHDLLTSTTYIGRHYFNRRDSRNQRARPPSEWVEVGVPGIVDDETFNAVQALLHGRNPKRTPPRVANGPTLLAGLIRCGHCGAAMIQNTGKGGVYRYYCCSRKLKEGATVCPSRRIPMKRLDDLVIGEVARDVLQPDRLKALLEAYVKSADDRDRSARDRLAQLRRDAEDAEAGITRLLELVEKGTMAAEDPTLRERLVSLRLRRDEAARDASELRRRLSEGEPEITPAKIEALARLIKDNLEYGSPDLRQAYARLVLRQVEVLDQTIRITGSKALLARAAAQGPDNASTPVLSFVREWRALQDSNLRPSA